MDGCLALERRVYGVRSRVTVNVKVTVRFTVTVRVHKFRYMNLLVNVNHCGASLSEYIGYQQ